MKRQKKPILGEPLMHDEMSRAETPKKASSKRKTAIAGKSTKSKKEKASRHLAISDSSPEVASIPVTKNTLQAAFLTPFRYPVDYHNLATQTARYAGMFFVVAGAALLLINIQGLNSFYAEIDSRAQVADSTSLTNTVEVSDTTINETADINATSEGEKSQPAANIVLDAPDPEAGYVDQKTDGVDTIRGRIDIKVSVASATNVELYLKDSAGNRTKIGTAALWENGDWILSWNSASAPDGKYELYAYVNGAQGMYDAGYEAVAIANSGETTLENTDATTTNEVREKEDISATTSSALRTSDTGSSTETMPLADTKSVANLKPDIALTLEGESPLSGIVEIGITVEGASFVELYAVPRMGLRELFLGLANKDENGRWSFKWNTIDTPNGEYSVLARVKNTYGLYDSNQQSVSVFNEPVIPVLTNEAEELGIEEQEETTPTTTSESNTLILSDAPSPEPITEGRMVDERSEVDTSLDSDSDGVSDYDELNLYTTDPSVADTDGDGFIDSAEILSGYDPKDSAPEALIAYESPKESSAETVDYLAVETITTDTSAQTDSKPPAAILYGKALPNSYVTLYIFSTPIVVTVKTNDDGSWSYRFDKELEDGEHEVYVGITDNAGRIIAKSDPFSFVKTAEAFTTADAEKAPVSIAATESKQPDDKMLLVILSLAVIALGLVLMLLGLHMQTHARIENPNPA